MNVTSYITKDYENMSNWAICENEPKTNPINPNFKGKKTRRKEKGELCGKIEDLELLSAPAGLIGK